MNNSKIIEKNQDAVVLIDLTMPDGNGKFKISIRGSGFIISEDGKFITCAHVYNEILENERQFLGVKVLTKMDEKGIGHYDNFKTKLLKMDKENDLVLMQIISEEKKKFTRIEKIGDSENVKNGDEIIFLGFPLAVELLTMGFGITMTANHVIISAIKRRGVDGSLHFFMIDTHVNNGSSGSPVFLRDSGKIIGIINCRISSKIPYAEGKIIDIPANMGTCLPVNYVKNLIE